MDVASNHRPLDYFAADITVSSSTVFTSFCDVAGTGFPNFTFNFSRTTYDLELCP